MPQAARNGDIHMCPKVNGIIPHVGGSIITPESRTVLIGGSPVAHQGDNVTCLGQPNRIATGSSTVFINGRPAARVGDQTTHGGMIVQGCPTVNIGG